MTDTLKDKLKQALEENADKSQKPKKNKTPLLIIIIVALIIIGLQYSTSIFSTGSSTDPQGKITTPADGSSTGKEVRVVGETKNINAGQYIWLAIDKPDLGLCWPKKRILRNTRFSTTILEEGPKEAYRLSLYVLNETFHDQWKDWRDQKIFGGLHMPPESQRLDQITLLLEY